MDLIKNDTISTPNLQIYAQMFGSAFGKLSCTQRGDYTFEENSNKPFVIQCRHSTDQIVDDIGGTISIPPVESVLVRSEGTESRTH